MPKYRHHWVAVFYKHIWRCFCENCGIMFNHAKKPWHGVVVDWGVDC